MDGLSVGEVAARLGVSPSAVRMWGTRYGLTASARSPGGHRRYTPDDLERLERMHAAVSAGTAPAAAAAEVERPVELVARRGPGGPGGSVLAVPGRGRAARGLARAAYRLDEHGVEGAVLEALVRDGTVPTWEDVVLPVLVASGDFWARSGKGIEVEHLLTQAVMTALVRHAAAQPPASREHPVLLACAPEEEHTLALYALRAALAERGVPARLLGPRTPTVALVAACRRLRPPGVLVWASVADAAAVEGLPVVAGAHRNLKLLVGGSGWEGAESVAPARRCRGLGAAADALARAWGEAGARGRQRLPDVTELARVADSAP